MASLKAAYARCGEVVTELAAARAQLKEAQAAEGAQALPGVSVEKATAEAMRVALAPGEGMLSPERRLQLDAAVRVALEILHDAKLQKLEPARERQSSKKAKEGQAGIGGRSSRASGRALGRAGLRAVVSTVGDVGDGRTERVKKSVDAGEQA